MFALIRGLEGTPVSLELGTGWLQVGSLVVAFKGGGLRVVFYRRSVSVSRDPGVSPSIEMATIRWTRPMGFV